MTGDRLPGPSVSFVGRQIGEYKVLDLLGAGGMGEVYRASDQKLHRFVALKILPLTATADEARQRLLAEARAAAALTHPYICKVHEVADVDALSFIVMECVTGETLRARLDRDPLPQSDALALAIELAEALDHAHAHGVVHRDLKPSNIMLADGHVKVLDFGMATTRLRASRPEAETETSPVTEPGVVKGTLAYMAPEQLRGEPADGRTDVFAFGIILFEMLTGLHPFTGRTSLETASAILQTEPQAWPESHPAPPLARHIVRKALAKTPASRYQSMHEVLTDLRAVVADSTGRDARPAESATRAPAPRSTFAIAAVAAVLVVGALAAYLATRRGTDAGDLHHRQLTFVGDVLDVDLSPDGRRIAYVRTSGSENALLVQELSGGPAVELTRARALRGPRWSPTGDRILYVAPVDRVASTYVIANLGGAPRWVANGDSAAWSPDGTRVASAMTDSSAVTVVNLTDSATTSVSIKDLHFLISLEWGGPSNRLLAAERNAEGLFAIWMLPLDGSTPTRVFSTSAPISDARWDNTADRILCFRRTDDALEVLTIDPNVPGAEPVVKLAGLPGGRGLSPSADGTDLVYVRRNAWSNIVRVDLSQPDRKRTPITEGTGVASTPAISPDGQWVAGVVTRGSRRYIVRWPANGGPPMELTSGDSQVYSPKWSPNSRQIAYVSNRSGKLGLWTMQADGGGQQELPVGPLANNSVVDWFPDGSIAWLQFRPPPAVGFSFRIRAPNSTADTWLTEEEFGYVFSPEFSPRGTEVAVYWNRGRPGLYVLTWPERKARFVQQGYMPIGWSSDGTVIYAFQNSTRTAIWAVSPTTGDAHVLEQIADGSVGSADVSRDGTFLVASVEKTIADVWVVENFRQRGR